MLLCLLAAILKPEFKLKPAPASCEGKDEVALEQRIIKALVLTLALPLDVQQSKLATAQAIQRHLVGRKLTWLHFVPDILEDVGML